MTPAELLTLEANMQILAAEDEIAAGVQDDDRLYDLVLLASGNKDTAGDALTARRMWRMRQKSK